MRIKLTIIAIITAVFIAPSFADNAKTTTSKGYVDTQIATKQDKVPAVDTNTVITTTNTTGEIGQKSIYDANGNYAEQADALVTAADANAAVQNAIDNEFVCVEWAPNTDETPENCYIWQIRNTVNPSKNLFDLDTARVISMTPNTEFNKLPNGYEVSNGSIYLEVGNIEDFIGKTLVSSYKRNCTIGTGLGILFYQNDSNGAAVGVYYNNPITITRKMADSVTTLAVRLGVDSSSTCKYTNIQIEEGSTATAYQPYGNTYIPSGN